MDFFLIYALIMFSFLYKVCFSVSRAKKSLLNWSFIMQAKTCRSSIVGRVRYKFLPFLSGLVVVENNQICRNKAV